jgi:Ca2+-binding RTX toxin-like protein
MRPSRTRTARTTTIAIATLLALGACASGALAGTLAYDGAAIVFTGGDNLDHEVQFRYDASTGRDHILDTHDITSWAPAARPPRPRRSPAAPATTRSEGARRARTRPFAGGGADHVDGGSGDDVIHGGDGDDGVFGFGGNDQVFGEGGNDR